MVKVLDLLLEAGARTIDVLPHDLTLVVDPVLPPEPPTMDHGLPGAWVWVAVGAALLGGILVGWGPRRRGRRRRAVEPQPPGTRST